MNIVGLHKTLNELWLGENVEDFHAYIDLTESGVYVTFLIKGEVDRHIRLNLVVAKTLIEAGVSLESEVKVTSMTNFVGQVTTIFYQNKTGA